MNRRSLAALVLLAGLLLAACGGPDGEDTVVRVFAASSLQDALPAVLAPFERARPGVTLAYQFAGSQTLATQIDEGAQADVFISANAEQADRLLAAGRATRAATLIENRIVIAVRPGAGITSIEDLARPGVRIAIGAPDVPVGALTRRVLELLDAELAAAIRANVVTEDPNVRIALSRVELGETDAAFVYHTDLHAAPDALALALPAAVAAPVNRYVVVQLVGATERAAAVFDYLLDPRAQDAFAARGFLPAVDATAAASPARGSNAAQ